MQARIRLTASVWTVLLLPLCDQARPWFRFSKRTSSVAGLALSLVAFSRAGLVVLFCDENGTAVLSTELWLWALIPAWWIERQSSLTKESSQKSEVRTRKLEVRRRKLEIRSGKSEVGNGKSEVRSRKKSEVRTVGSGRSEGLTIQLWVWTIRNQKPRVRTLSSLKSEVWSWKSEVGSRKSEVGSRKSEVGRPSSAFVL